jgi:hypothetical protein
MDPTILVLLVGEASGVFAGFCPSWFTVASPFFHEQDAKQGNINRIRAGEIAATAVVIGTGWAVSRREKSNWALWASVIISLIFIVGYEFQIAHPSQSKKNGSDVPAMNMLFDMGSVLGMATL